MSLEKAIEANTKALEALTAKLTGASMAVTAAAPAKDALPPKAAAEAAQRAKPVAETVAAPAAGAATPAAPVAGAITRDTLKAKVLKLCEKDEPKAAAILANYGGKLPAVKPEDYPALDADLTAALPPATAGSLV